MVVRGNMVIELQEADRQNSKLKFMAMGTY